MEKPAPTAYPILPLIANRWSPRAFAPTSVENEKVCTLLEAARWAASSFNEQPWRFVVGHRERTPDTYAQLQTLLMDGNDWAKKAPVLMLSVAAKRFKQTGKPNRHALHDVGLAVSQMVLQAEALGIACHQMAGFHSTPVFPMFNLSPADFEPVAMLAFGYPGDPNTLPEPLKSRELGPRTRRPLQETAFGAAWESPYPGCWS